VRYNHSILEEMKGKGEGPCGGSDGAGGD